MGYKILSNYSLVIGALFNILWVAVATPSDYITVYVLGMAYLTVVWVPVINSFDSSFIYPRAEYSV